MRHLFIVSCEVDGSNEESQCLFHEWFHEQLELGLREFTTADSSAADSGSTAAMASAPESRGPAARACMDTEGDGPR